MTINEILRAIRATSSKLEKRAILASHKDNELLREFLNAVYNPRLQYGIKVMPKEGKNVLDLPPREFRIEDVGDLTHELAGRQVTGKLAKQLLASKLAALDSDGKELLGYIIARDVNAGMAENTVLSVWPGMFFIPPYQRCASMDEKIKERFAAMESFFEQTKSDGQFVYAINRHDPYDTLTQRRVAMSRAGSEYPAWVANQITAGLPQGNVAMGEMLVVRDGKVMSRKDGNGVLNSVLSGDGSKFKDTDTVRFLAWDMVTEQEFDAGMSDRPYRSRWHDLVMCTRIQRVDNYVVKSLHEASIIHNQKVAEGEEGTVWKNPDMGWRDCQSGDKDMVKVKVVFEAEYEIEGAYVHKKNPNMLGGFNMKTSDGLIRFDAGSGFSDQQRLDYWSMLKNNPHAFDGTIATCEGNDIVTSKGKSTESVFLPIFIEIRLDKKTADDRSRVWEQFNAAKEGKKL